MQNYIIFPRSERLTSFLRAKLSNGKILLNREKSEYTGVIGSMGIVLIYIVHVFIRFSEVVGFN